MTGGNRFRDRRGAGMSAGVKAQVNERVEWPNPIERRWLSDPPDEGAWGGAEQIMAQRPGNAGILPACGPEARPGRMRVRRPRSQGEGPLTRPPIRPLN